MRIAPVSMRRNWCVHIHSHVFLAFNPLHFLQIVCIEVLRKKGIVHRDVKPANIVFTPDGHLRLLDFGLSARYTPRPDDEDLNSSSCALAFEVDETADSGSFLFPVQDSVWTSSSRCGTCHFMTPEQHQGLPYGIEVDEWAIGVILHCMLTARVRGFLPFQYPFLIRADFSVVHRCLSVPTFSKRIKWWNASFINPSCSRSRTAFRIQLRHLSKACSRKTLGKIVAWGR